MAIGGFDLWCLRWRALVREAEERELRVLMGSKDGCFVKMGERGRVKVVGLGALDDEDEAKRQRVKKMRERSDSAAMNG